MPENDTTPAAPEKEAPSIPPLETSPEFVDRTKAALGGNPDKPPVFGAIGYPEPQEGGKDAAAAPQAKKRPHDAAFDGPPPELVQARQVVGNLSPHLAAIRDVLDAHLPKAKEALAAIKDDKKAKAEATLQGIDLVAVNKFLTTLEKAQAKDQ